MDGTSLIASALLTLMLLPIAVAAWDRWRVPDGLYLAIAAAGIGYSYMRNGVAGAASAVLVGLACLLLVAAAISLLKARQQVRLLLGGHIKLLGAGATWLSAQGAVVMTLVSFSLFVFCALFLRARRASNTRPEFAPIATFSILMIQLQHSIF